MTHWRLLATAVNGLALLSCSYGQTDVQVPKQNLASMSLEDLMKVEVTTSSKRPEPYFDVPAAIYVITADEIQASGARNIPDLLRMVPGISVQQTGSNQWMVASRGFIDTFTNKLLVLVDGRSIYTPTFGGVDWSMQDLIVDDIERIEVIRGPGGSLWGANAVNGIINIITKTAHETKGTLLESGVGSSDRLIESARYSSPFGKYGDLKIYTKYRDFAGTTVVGTNTSQGDSGSDRRAGFRYDGKAATTNFTFQGEASGEHFGQTLQLATSIPPAYNVAQFDVFNPSSWFLMAKGDRPSHGGTTDDSVQTYFDHVSRNAVDASEVRNTFDIEAQRTTKLNERNSAEFGFGYRRSEDHTIGTTLYFFAPPNDRVEYISAFGQFESKIGSKSNLTVGTKLERNSYTGWEFQPSARFSNTPDPNHTYWVSVTRAVRTPTLVDRSSYDAYLFDPTVPAFSTYVGSKTFKSEKLIAYEAGARIHPSPKLTVDLAVFYNNYSDLRSSVVGAVMPNPYDPAQLDIPYYLANGIHGDTAGFETSGKWDVTKRMRLNFSYSYFAPMIRIAPGNTIDPTINIESTPRNLFSLIGSYKLADNLDASFATYYQDAMEAIFVGASWRVDLNVVWHPSKNVDAVVTAQNVTAPRRFEGQTTDFTYASQFRRNLYVGLKFKF